MISAPTGGIQKVRGRIIAIVVSGPMPGSTPIAVPITQPKKHRPMFCQVSATPKPITMLERTSGMSERRRPQRNLDSHREHEDADVGDDENEAQERQRQRADAAAGEARQHDADQECENQPERLEQERKG